MVSLRVVKHGTGIHLTYGEVDIALDAGIRGIPTLLSHAHADHIGGLELANHVISTEATRDTFLARGGRLKAKTSFIKFGETLGQVGVYITAMNAGHVLGSTMFKIEFEDGMTVLYTGDFNVVDSVVHDGAVPTHADVLITEATYGSPRWIFPSRKKVHEQILDTAKQLIEWGKIPVFQAYSLGKAQEAIALLRNSDITVVSGNHSIDLVSDVYIAHGKDLNYISLRSGNAKAALKAGCVIVSSSPKFTMSNVGKALGSSYRKDLSRRMERYNLSGWTLGEIKSGGFPLSAHTDFPNLIEFAKAVEPKLVYCFTSNAGELSGHLAQHGLNAVPLE